MFKYLFFFLGCGFTLILLVNSQDQSGFVSIDCGEPSSYTDSETGINYIPDTSYIDTGITKTASSLYQGDDYPQLLWNLRIFPEGLRNCYNVKVKKATRYLIRTTFLYGNYDGKSEAPEFDIHLGANFWSSINLVNDSTIVTKEIIHIPSSDFIYVCLVNTGLGTPLISGLEFRKLNNLTYIMDSGSLALYRRLDVASKTNKTIRFTDDVYDRIWSPIHFTAKELTTNQTINFDAGNYDYSPPQSVMDSAAEGYTTGYLNFTLNIQDSSEETYLYFYFAELEKQSNESRSFDIYFNGEYADGPYTPFNLKSSVVYPANPWPAADLKVSFKQTKDSTRPPLLNAMEIFLVRKLFQSETVQQDVTAVLNINSKYKLAKDWQGDPCSPRKYVWDGLNCSYQDYDPPRIILLNLSSTGMTGEIANYILNLTMLEVLDLSNNSLSGSVPEFITQLSSLKVLNLAGNNFSGSVPDKLLERSKAGTLSLSIDEQNNCTSSSCQKKKKTSNIIVPIVAAVASIFVIIVAGACIFLVVKRRKGQGSVTANKPDIQNQWMKSKNRRFTYGDVLKITNNLETVIGEGGFGKVYLGYLDNQNKVAVKVLSVLARHGLQQFQAEVDLLMRVHHRNLTSLVGYCEEDNKIALIYEYMANGDLSKHLSEKRTSILSWEGRLKIAIEAAQGLEYLHHGCKPPIVHRDIKTANILLNNEFQAKIADFGLSKSFPTEVGTHVTTVVAGTPGYLDPQYHMTGQLTEKSDVYSFGVVLLNIITCRPVISQNNHVSKWVNSMLSGGDIQAIVDQRLHGNFDKNSAWKFVEIGMACVSESAAKRPTMNEVVIELKNCLDLEKSRRCEGMSTANESSLESFSMFVMHSGLTLPRN